MAKARRDSQISQQRMPDPESDPESASLDTKVFLAVGWVDKDAQCDMGLLTISYS